MLAKYRVQIPGSYVPPENAQHPDLNNIAWFGIKPGQNSAQYQSTAWCKNYPQNFRILHLCTGEFSITRRNIKAELSY
jgi:hypothetical protein